MSKIITKNIKPFSLEPNYNDSIKDDFDDNSLNNIVHELFIEKLDVPMVTGYKTEIIKDKKEITKDELTNIIIDSYFSETRNIDSEKIIEDIFNQTLKYRNKNTFTNIDEVFLHQAGQKEGLDDPTPNIVYTINSDIIPSCKDYIRGLISEDYLFASFGFYTKSKTLGFAFINENAFENFKNWLKANIQPFSNVISKDDMSMFNDFFKLNLKNLTESLKIRNEYFDNSQKFSFQRILIKMLFKYKEHLINANTSEGLVIMPFSVRELISPKNIVFINIEKHAKSSSKEISENWSDINKALNSPLKMISNKKLTKLDSIQKSLKRLKNMTYNTMAQEQNRLLALTKLSKTEPNSIDLAKTVKKVIDRSGNKNMSMNVYKQHKTTYAKPNRRNPDDFNLKGVTTSTSYKPDIHIYLDTSGSISEREYEDTMKQLIKLAKKLNIDMYFNSFSHILSQTTKLNIKGKSTKAIYSTFQKVPKVTGGTDFYNVWKFILNSKKRNNEISIIITDFCYSPPFDAKEHPKNLYYLPISNSNWNTIINYCEDFIQATAKIEPNIRKHILF